MISTIQSDSDQIKAEQDLLGCILIDASRCHDVFSLLNGSDFLDADLGRLYLLLSRLASMGKPVSNSKWIASEISGTAVYAAIGPARFYEIVSSVANAAHAVFLAETIKKHSQRRMLRRVAQRLLLDCDDYEMDIDEAAQRATKGIVEVTEHSLERDTFSAKECIASAMNRVQVILNRESDGGITTGIRCIDSIAGSMLPGEHVVLGARTSIGKTSLALDTAINAARAGRKVLYVSCEMGAESIGCRFLSYGSGIDCESISEASLNSESAKKLARAAESQNDLSIHVWVASAPTVQAITSKCRSHAAKIGLDLVVVDHMGLLRAPGTKGRYEAMTEISGALKSMATGLQVPVLTLCQLNRSGDESELPSLSMLRDSGAIEQDADKVWLLHRTDRARIQAVFYVAKYRNGSVGTTQDGHLVFDSSRCSFRDAKDE